MAKQMTPIIRPLRNGSGTLYAFPSAVEDIGLNLDSTANKIALSKFVVLNLPSADTSDTNIKANHFNFTNIPGIANTLNNNTSLNERQKVASALQNYMMNMEATIINQDDYDYSASATVSERVFWKFLKECGAIRWVPVDTDKATLNGKRLYMEEEEDPSTGYKRVVQSVGQIGGGNAVSGEFGMYNETYVNIPSTYGASQIFFKIQEDHNYRLGEIYESPSKDYLSGRDSASSAETYTMNYPIYDSLSESEAYNDDIVAYVKDSGGLPWYKVTDETNDVDYAYFTESEFDPDSNADINFEMEVIGGVDKEVIREFTRSRLDGVQLVNDIDEITNIYEQYFSKDELGFISFDSINIEPNLIKKTNYDFNAILLYYTIYDKDNHNELATNAFGIIFLNSPMVENNDLTENSGDSLKFNFPVYHKQKSNGAGSDTYFGTGYSFKVNVRSLSIYDNTDAYIQDETTGASLYTEDFNDVIFNLNKSVEGLQKNSQILAGVFEDYRQMNLKVNSLSSGMQKIEEKVNTLNSRKLTDIQSENIKVSTDFESVGNSYFKGLFKLDENIECDIPYLDVSTLRTVGIESDDISVGNLHVNDTISSSIIFADYINVDTLNFQGGDFNLDNAIQYFGMNSNVVQEIEAPFDTESSDSIKNTNLGLIESILDKMDIVKTKEGDLFEVNPESFDVNRTGKEWTDSIIPFRSHLYKTKDEGKESYASYMNLIPLLIAEIQQLRKEVNELKKS